MKILSVREFKEFCDHIKPNGFIFASENQPWYQNCHTIRAQLTFEIMSVAFNPNSICFQNEGGKIHLDRVKYVKTNNEKSLLGIIFTAVCGDFSSNSEDTEYVIVVQ